MQRGTTCAFDIAMNTQDAKAELTKQVEKVERLADEIKVKLHLATLDAKQEWDEKLSPKLLELKDAAKRSVDQSGEKVSELLKNLETFAGKLRGGSQPSS